MVIDVVGPSSKDALQLTRTGRGVEVGLCVCFLPQNHMVTGLSVSQGLFCGDRVCSGTMLRAAHRFGVCAGHYRWGKVL